MTKNQEMTPAYEGALESARDQFEELARRVSGMDFEKEAMFATQVLMGNSFLAKVATTNPASVRMSVINVAAVGLSLNPAQGLAFLVPRDGRVMLDISYRGLIRIAIEEGAISAAKAELVYEKDHFRYRGPFEAPVHECDPFATDRGARRGVYCVARLPDGGFLTEIMSEQDIEMVKGTSESASRGKGPWVAFPGEMAKKSVVKRASKWWQAQGGQRLSEAVRVLNEDNGEGFSHGSSGGVASPVFEHEDEPDTADPEKVEPKVKAKIEELCRRAARSSQWAAAEEYIEQRYSGNDRVYARLQLQNAKLEAEAAAEAGDQSVEADQPQDETEAD